MLLLGDPENLDITPYCNQRCYSIVGVMSEVKTWRRSVISEPDNVDSLVMNAIMDTALAEIVPKENLQHPFPDLSLFYRLRLRNSKYLGLALVAVLANFSSHSGSFRVSGTTEAASVCVNFGFNISNC